MKKRPVACTRKLEELKAHCGENAHDFNSLEACSRSSQSHFPCVLDTCRTNPYPKALSAERTSLWSKGTAQAIYVLASSLQTLRSAMRFAVTNDPNQLVFLTLLLPICILCLQFVAIRIRDAAFAASTRRS